MARVRKNPCFGHLVVCFSTIFSPESRCYHQTGPSLIFGGMESERSGGLFGCERREILRFIHTERNQILTKQTCPTEWEESFQKPDSTTDLHREKIANSCVLCCLSRADSVCCQQMESIEVLGGKNSLHHCYDRSIYVLRIASDQGFAKI